MKRSFFILFIWMVFRLGTGAQEEYYLPAEIIDGDTVAILTLPECTIEDDLNYRLKKLKEHNEKLIRNVAFVMPYAKICAARLKQIDENAALLKTENERKKYYNEEEKKLRNEFEDDLLNMNSSQGKLLIKLIDRETGKTTYKIIQQYKNSFMAVFWQGFARLFGYNLKSGYNPNKEKEIEEVIKLLGYN